MRGSLALIGIVSLLGCGGGGSRMPTAPTPAQTTITVAGRITATNGGQPIGGVSVQFADVTATTNAAGGYALSVPAVGGQGEFTVSGPSIVTRRLQVSVAPRTIDVDVIALADGFDLGFYRQLVRNAFETPATLQRLKRQRDAPRIYLRTIDESGRPVDAVTLDTTAAALINTAGALTGRFGLATLERGTESRLGQPGWITVQWQLGPDLTHFLCGRAPVGGDRIDFYPDTPGCACNGSRIKPSVTKHELGHALGFWHTSDPSDLMYATLRDCDREPTARERYHAAIAYARAIGNADPDDDRFTGNVLRSPR